MLMTILRPLAVFLVMVGMNLYNIALNLYLEGKGFSGLSSILFSTGFTVLLGFYFLWSTPSLLSLRSPGRLERREEGRLEAFARRHPEVHDEFLEALRAVRRSHETASVAASHRRGRPAGRGARRGQLSLEEEFFQRQNREKRESDGTTA